MSGSGLVRAPLARDYYDAAAVISAELPLENIAALIGGRALGPAEKASFIHAAVSGAFRRPASADELAAYGEIFELGTDSAADGTGPFRAVISAPLTSPFFLYRTEIGVSAHIGLMGLESGTRNWHEVAHMSLDDKARAVEVSVASAAMTSNQAYVQFDRLWASQVAYLARRLAALPEGDGSMLDNTLIYWGAESGTDHNHSPHDMQYLLIGGRNLGLATGQFLQPAAVRSAHELHTSVLHAFGLEAAGFGIEPNCGPLAGVLR
jgi:hypothetical protein